MEQDRTNTKKNIDWAVEAFVEAMKAVLLEPENMKKETWSKCDEMELEEKLVENCALIDQEIVSTCEPERYERKCLHIANYAMMLWQNCVYARSLKEEKEDANATK